MRRYHQNHILKFPWRGIVPLLCLALMGAHMGLVKGPASLQSKQIVKPANSSIDQLKLKEKYGNLPLYFEANHGQLDPQARFVSRGSGYSLFVTPREAVLALRIPETKSSAKPDSSKHRLKKPVLKQSVIRMRLDGADPKAVWHGEEKMKGTANYFIGNDPSKWRTKVPLYAKVKAKNVYPGIDMVYYGNQRSLEYDFIVNPGADPSAIQITYKGAKETSVDEHGNLVLKTQGGEVLFRTPRIYQRTANGKVDVGGR